jgi:hypothetical protein|nr:MAG TPA: hypothetical protein [Caudoviricetes sp.]
MEAFEKFSDLYMQVGFWGVVFVILLFVFIIFVYDLMRHINPVIIEKFVKIRKMKANFEISLKRLGYVKKFTVKNASIFCPKRKQIFIDFVSSRINAFIKSIEYINREKLEKLTDEELYYHIKEIIWDAMSNSDKEMLSEGVPTYVLEKYKSIEEDELKMLERLVRQVCFSKNIYRSNREKAMVIFDFICVVADVAIINGEKTIDKLNGQLDGIIYKGIGCQSCPKTDCKKNGENHV